VHHAVNDAYVDKNYGGILIVWDRLFGTFKEEDPHDPCVYGAACSTAGTRCGPMPPSTASWRTTAGRHAAGATRPVVWLPPGWQPADVALRFPKPAFDLAAHRQRFAPPMARAAPVCGAGLAALVGGAVAFLWQADQAPLSRNLWGFGVLLAGQWTLGAAMQSRMHWGLALALQAAAAGLAALALR
jgi:hypothetical protein